MKYRDTPVKGETTNAQAEYYLIMADGPKVAETALFAMALPRFSESS